jgi:soluble lytic murein transglycosylase-like protein
MANQGAGKAILFGALSLGVFAFAMTLSGSAQATEKWLKKVGKGKIPKTLKNAAANFSGEIVASARKWATARKVPLLEILATILLESRGNPKAHALTAKEDSRGSMQVNIRAHGDLLKARGYTPDDLYRVDVGIEIGSLIYAQARARVAALAKACKAPQTHDLSTLTRLYYAGPKYVIKMLQKAKNQADTVRPFKNSDVYVSHWHDALDAVASVYGRR